MFIRRYTTAKLQQIRLQIQRDQRPAPQIPNQSYPTDILNLRYSPANQAPAKSSKYYMPATWGGASTSCAYVFTAMVTLPRARARPWHPGTLLPRPASGFGESSANPTHSNSNVQRLGDMDTAPPRDAATASTGEPACHGPACGLDPRGIGAGRTRQKPAGAAPDRAGRMTDHAGQARRHASAWVRSLHFPTLSRIS